MSSLRAATTLLGFLIPVGSFSLLTGAALRVVPWANPVIWTGTGLATIGTFLLTLSNETSDTTFIGGLSCIAGAGFGIAQSLSIIFGQQWVPNRDLQPLMISMGLTVQLFGGSFGLVLGATILTNRITSKLEDLFPSVPASVREQILAGLSYGSNGVELDVLEEMHSQLPRIAAESTDIIFYMAGAAAGLAFMLAMGITWRKTLSK